MKPKLLTPVSLLTMPLSLPAQREKSEAQWGLDAATVGYGTATWRAAFDVNPREFFNRGR